VRASSATLCSSLGLPPAFPVQPTTNCPSAFRIDSPISVWSDYINVNHKIKPMHTIIKIAVVSFQFFFAILGLNMLFEFEIYLSINSFEKLFA
jgi:hypothetical protein